MKWLEFIRVRSSEATLKTALPDLEALVLEIGAALPAADAHLLRHGLYDGDLAMVIVWRNDLPPARSRSGLGAAVALSALGAVDHAVWSPTCRGCVEAGGS